MSNDTLDMARSTIGKNGFLDIELDPSLDLFAEIERLKKEKNAVLLAHYYQEPDIQDVADYVRGRLGLVEQAENTTAGLIRFSGVEFIDVEGANCEPSS